MMDVWLPVQVGKVLVAAGMEAVLWKAREELRWGKVLEVEVEGWGRTMMAMSVCHGGSEAGWTEVEVEEMAGGCNTTHEAGKI